MLLPLSPSLHSFPAPTATATEESKTITIKPGTSLLAAAIVATSVAAQQTASGAAANTTTLTIPAPGYLEDMMAKRGLLNSPAAKQTETAPHLPVRQKQSNLFEDKRWICKTDHPYQKIMKEEIEPEEPQVKDCNETITDKQNCYTQSGVCASESIIL